MLNPFKLSDHFLEIYDFLRRKFIITYRKMDYSFKDDKYINLKYFKYYVLSQKGIINIDYEVENLIYLKINNIVRLEQKGRLQINLDNLNKSDLALEFVGYDDTILENIKVTNRISTDFDSLKNKVSTAYYSRKNDEISALFDYKNTGVNINEPSVQPKALQINSKKIEYNINKFILTDYVK